MYPHNSNSAGINLKKDNKKFINVSSFLQKFNIFGGQKILGSFGI